MKGYMNRVIIFIIGYVMLLVCGNIQNVQAQTDLPKKAIIKFNEAYNAYLYGQFDEAEKLYNQLIKKYPNFIDAYDGLAKMYQSQKRDRQAINMYRHILTMDQKHYYATYELGNLYHRNKQIDSAKHFYNSFLRINGSSKDENVDRVRRKLDNLTFTEEALRNPVNIEPINMGDKINNQLEQYSPALTIDESTLFYTFRDPNVQNEDLYYSTKKDGEWSVGKNIGPPINTIENEGAFSVSSDGNYIFFTSCSRPGGVGQCDIWLTMNKNGIWTDPGNLGKPVNSKHWESQPSIAANGKELFFTSDRPGGFGGTDIWVVAFGDEGWEEPVNLGPTINTSGDEQFPFIHSDGVTLYFSSEGHPGLGKSDLFVTHRKPDQSWETPLNLGYPINSFGEDWNLIVARDGKTAYYSSNNKKDGRGGMDLYSFELPEEKRALKVSYVKGTIRDADTKKPLGAGVTLTPLNNSEPTFVYAPDKTGVFIVALVADTKYALSIKKPGYLFHSEHFDMPNVDTDEPFELFIDLKKVEVGNGIVLKNLFFDTDKYELKPESESELNRLHEFLVNNPTIIIEISGHTDNVGSSAHNQTLSQNRSKAVYNYLIDKGIDASKLSFKGYGDTHPIASNDTEIGRAKNRRTEFIIIE
jgi:flagellar motor protein MotB